MDTDQRTPIRLVSDCFFGGWSWIGGGRRATVDTAAGFLHRFILLFDELRGYMDVKQRAQLIKKSGDNVVFTGLIVGRSEAGGIDFSRFGRRAFHFNKFRSRVDDQ